MNCQCHALPDALRRSCRLWMNVTQEGKSAVDDLRELGLVNGLKLTSEDFQPITAFQVSLKVTRALHSTGANA
jgi:hypothetical protein